MSRIEIAAARRSVGQRGMKWMLSGMVVAVAATFALSAWAQPAGPGAGMHGMHGMAEPGMMMGGGRGVDRMLDGLNATDAQRTQIKQIGQAAAADMKAQHEAFATAMKARLQTFAAGSFDAAAFVARCLAAPPPPTCGGAAPLVLVLPRRSRSSRRLRRLVPLPSRRRRHRRRRRRLAPPRQPASPCRRAPAAASCTTRPWRVAMPARSNILRMLTRALCGGCVDPPV